MGTVNTSTNGLLLQLAASLRSAGLALPDGASAIPSPDGISLLGVKNELLVSYLQNLVFLILFKLKNSRPDTIDALPDASVTKDNVVNALVQLRINLEKGVRPLEERIRYQIEKVVRAADLAEGVGQPKTQGSAEGLEQEDADGDMASGVIDELSYRPNPASLARTSGLLDHSATPHDRSDDVYRPPRINPTAPPVQIAFDDRKRSSIKPQRSYTIDKYIDTEMSIAPVAEPSIGSTIIAGGRHTKSDKERRQDQERTTYEEANFTRLAPPTKLERAKKAARQRSAFGGEDMQGLGEGLDRIDRLTSKRGPTERHKRRGTRDDVRTPHAKGAKRRRTGDQ